MERLTAPPAEPAGFAFRAAQETGAGIRRRQRSNRKAEQWRKRFLNMRMTVLEKDAPPSAAHQASAPWQCSASLPKRTLVLLPFHILFKPILRSCLAVLGRFFRETAQNGCGTVSSAVSSNRP
jgi:hypothetical protein